MTTAATFSTAFSVGVSTPANTPNPTPENRTLYLNKSIEDLRPEKLAECKRTATKWHAISIVTGVAFFALAIGATIAASIIAPAFTSLVALSAILLAIPAAAKVGKFYTRYLDAKNEANAYKELQRHHTDLANKTPADLKRILFNDMGILWNQIPGIEDDHPERLKDFIPLIAKAKYFETAKARNMELSQKHLTEANALPTTTETQKLEKEYKYHLALDREDVALRFKVKQAFVNAVLRNPNIVGNVYDVGTYSAMSSGTGAVCRQLDGPNAEPLFTFNRDIAPLTYDEVKNSSVANLGRKMLAAMAA